MTLGFSTQHRDGTPTLFEQKILLPYEKQIEYRYPNLIPKIHTFRLGHRWRSGMKMHMVTGNRTKQRSQFNAGYPQLEFCTRTQECVITCVQAPMPGIRIEVEGKEINDLLFMVNDGFDNPDQFFDWFGHPYKPTEHVGQIVHWTDFRY